MREIDNCNKDSLYCTGNYIHYLVITYNGKKSEKEYIYYIYIYESESVSLSVLSDTL